MPMNELPKPPHKTRDPLNIMGSRSDSKAEWLAVLSWLNAVTLIAAIATGIGKLLGKMFGRPTR